MAQVRWASLYEAHCNTQSGILPSAQKSATARAGQSRVAPVSPRALFEDLLQSDPIALLQLVYLPQQLRIAFDPVDMVLSIAGVADGLDCRWR